MEPRFSQIVLGIDTFQGIETTEGVETPFSAGWPLFIIGQARQRGCDFEKEADGYGPGDGTHGDWSGIRDSSFEALERMTAKALNYLFSVDEGSAHLIRHMFDGSDSHEATCSSRHGAGECDCRMQSRPCACRPDKKCPAHPFPRLGRS